VKLAALKATGKPIILVLASGSAVAVDPASADAILTMWYPGEAGGTAIADTLAGVSNPSGRLPVTVYGRTSDLPAFVDYGMKERTYRYFTGTPLWGFGHGLSYTRFGYEAVAAPGIATGAPITVTARVTNSGARAGEEVVQAYLIPPKSDEPAGFTDPVLQRQLAAFTRVGLKPGETKTVSLRIDPRTMGSVFRDGARRVLPGTYRLWIGGGQPDAAAGRWIDVAVTGSPLDMPK
jgi:beta-glucosidase